MPTFSDGESGASIRSKLNSTIATVDALTDQYAWKTIAVSGQDSVVADAVDDTLTLVAGTGMSITTNAAGDSITFAATAGGGGVDQIVYVSKTAAEAATFSAAPDTLLLSGFNAANEFGYAKAYAYAGTTQPAHSGFVTIPIAGVNGTVNHYYVPDIDSMVTPQMYGGGQAGLYYALNLGKRVDLGTDTVYTISVTLAIANVHGELYVTGDNVIITANTGRVVGAGGAMLAFANGTAGTGAGVMEKLYWEASTRLLAQSRYSSGFVVTAASSSSEIVIKNLQVYNVVYNPTLPDVTTDPYRTDLHWQGLGIGVEGTASGTGDNDYALLHIENCGVFDVSRTQSLSLGGDQIVCWGIMAHNARKTRIINCTIDGVYLKYDTIAGQSGLEAPSGWADADGITYYTDYIAASNWYQPGDFLMEGCTIKNCQGRFLKTKQTGYSVIRNNTFVLNRVMNASSAGFDLINASGSWYAFDEQEMPSIIEDNTIDFQVYINDQQAGTAGEATIVGHRAGSGSGTQPIVELLYLGTKPFRGTMGFGAFRRNTIYYRYPNANFAYKLGRIISVDLGPLVASGTARHLTFDYSDNVVSMNGGWNAGSSTLHAARVFFAPANGDLDSIGATAVFRVNRNYAETRYFTQTANVTADTNTLSEVTNNTHSTGEASSAFAIGTGTQVTRDNTTI